MLLSWLKRVCTMPCIMDSALGHWLLQKPTTVCADTPFTMAVSVITATRFTNCSALPICTYFALGPQNSVQAQLNLNFNFKCNVNALNSAGSDPGIQHARRCVEESTLDAATANPRRLHLNLQLSFTLQKGDSVFRIMFKVAERAESCSTDVVQNFDSKELRQFCQGTDPTCEVKRQNDVYEFRTPMNLLHPVIV